MDDLDILGHDIVVHDHPGIGDHHLVDHDNPDALDSVDHNDLDTVVDDQLLLLVQDQSQCYCDDPGLGPGQCLSRRCQQHHPVYILDQSSGFL